MYVSIEMTVFLMLDMSLCGRVFSNSVNFSLQQGPTNYKTRVILTPRHLQKSMHRVANEIQYT